MTAVAIISGLLPVMFGSGTGSEIMRRIASPMVGGMISSLILTMLVIPAAYLLWEWHRLRKLEGRPVEVMRTGSSIED
jgi:Cu(I)/Ag(I) efflux system membrane protein CusA/SilA